MEFSITKMKEVIKAQSGKRVSKEAAQELSSDLEDRGLDISQKAQKIAESKGRVTVKSEDIRDALK